MENTDKKLIIHDWLDSLGKSLEKEAELAGLLEHPTMIGTAREFIIQNILKRCLPPIIHYGSGKIFDSDGGYSKQIDLIIFDPRFPCLEITKGSGLYPIEGVIATIEIKSTITRSEIWKALDNQMSVLERSPKIIDPDRGKRNSAIQNIIKKGMPERRAEREVSYKYWPSTYVFSFNTKLKKQALSDKLDKWCKANFIPESQDGICLKFPRIIVAGKTIALLSDGFISIDPGKDVVAQWKKSENKEEYKHLIGVWDVERRFGWFAQHLIFDVCNRIGLMHSGISKIDYAVEQYLVKSDYFRKEMNGEKAYYCLY